MPRTTRTFEELATDFYLRSFAEVARFLGVPKAKAKRIYEAAYRMDEEQGSRGTSYVRRKTVMKLEGITQKDVEEKMRMLEHPQNE